MKRLLTAVSLLVFAAVATPASAAPSPAPAKGKVHPGPPLVPHVVFLKYKVAPADEYFGRLKMSILGIRNTIKDMGLKADADPTHASSVLGSVGLTEDALHDWEKKYPHDTWLPPAILSLERLYAKVDTDDARSKAKYTMVWLVRDYPTSEPGKIGKHELAENLVGVKPVAALPAPDASSATLAGQASGPAAVGAPDAAAPVSSVK